MRNKNIIHTALVVFSILLFPLVAMQFTDEVVWGVGDFIVFGALLLGACLSYGIFARKINNTKHRVILAFMITITLFFVWAELSVGIFGTLITGF